MAIEFENPVTAGTVLIREAIESQNFVSGSAGWQIAADGSAEFSDVVLRGDGTGDTVIVGPSNGPQVRIATTATYGEINFPTNRPIEGITATIRAAVVNSGAANESAQLQLFGPSVTGATDALAVFVNSQNDDGSSNANFTIAGGGTIFYVDTDEVHSNRPVEIFPTSNSVTSCIINAPSGMTGNLLSLQVNGNTLLDIDENGVITEYANNAFSTYTPTVTNGGTATFTGAAGWYQRVGKMVYVNAEFTVNAAGSGAGIVTVSLPSTPFRNAGVSRQVIPIHAKGMWTAGMAADGNAVILETGTGAVVDQLAMSNDNALNRDGVVTGANLLAGSRLTISGWYREA